MVISDSSHPEILLMTETVQSHYVQQTPYYENHPWFFDSWRRRHQKHKNLILCSTGQSLGIGKSYWMLAAFEKMYPDFTVEQVVFVPKQFWDVLETLPHGEWAGVIWDDPTKGLSKRDWYKDLNKTVTSFMKTASRYKRRDLGFALPSFDDLDISVREITTLEAQMKEAGIAKIHRVKRNRFGNPPFWKPYLGEVQLPTPKLASAYEKRRDEFHAESYTETEFEEKPIENIFSKVYSTVKIDQRKYSLETHEGSGKWKLSARVISAVLDCSDQTARKVITRLEFESRVQPLE